MRSPIVHALVRLALLGFVTAGATVAALFDPSIAATSGPTPGDLAAACAGGDPYFVTTSLDGVSGSSTNVYDLDAPAIFLFSDTARNKPHYSLATLEQVGAVFGLAYRKADESIYAAAYHKVQLPFGPGGPGAIYRIDLDTGAVSVAVTVPNAGEDHHEQRIINDRVAEEWTSRTSLGDIDLGADGTELFAMNLADRRIYRFALPSGVPLGSFAHGAAGESWAASARPFALAWHEGHLYHGVVNSAEETARRDDLRGVVYRSLSDGSGMEQVLAFELGYRRGRVTWPSTLPVAGSALEWRPWRDGYTPGAETWLDRYSTYPMPLLADLAFDDQGNMVIGLRDRRSDASAVFRTDFGTGRGVGLTVGLGVGDILRATVAGAIWEVDTGSEHYNDRIARFGDECALGGLAGLPGLGMTVAGAYVTEDDRTLGGAYWFDDADGNPRGREQVGDRAAVEPYRADLAFVDRALAHDGETPPISRWTIRGPATVGDVEVLCAPAIAPTSTASPTATATPTATAPPTATRPPSPTACPSPLPTTPPTRTPPPSPASTARPTPTPPPRPLYLPLLLRERCPLEKQRVDVALVIDASTTMRDDRTSAGRSRLDAAIEAAAAFVDALALPGDQAAVVAFNSTSWVEQGLTGRRADIARALARIPNGVQQQTRIDRGIREAHQELVGPRHLPTNRQVMIVLTDGLANPEPVSTAVQRAAEAKADGITIFSVGLGAEGELDVPELTQMASRPEYFFRAPDAEDLVRIYRAIAVELPCPGVPLWARDASRDGA